MAQHTNQCMVCKIQTESYHPRMVLKAIGQERVFTMGWSKNPLTDVS